jgi:hypothetical protein
MKILIMQFSPASCHLICLHPKCPPQHPQSFPNAVSYKDNASRGRYPEENQGGKGTTKSHRNSEETEILTQRFWLFRPNHVKRVFIPVLNLSYDVGGSRCIAPRIRNVGIG